VAVELVTIAGQAKGALALPQLYCMKRRRAERRVAPVSGDGSMTGPR
jgi:hypothetical protein